MEAFGSPSITVNLDNSQQTMDESRRSLLVRLYDLHIEAKSVSYSYHLCLRLSRAYCQDDRPIGSRFFVEPLQFGESNETKQLIMGTFVEMVMWLVICIGLPVLLCIFTKVAVWRKIIGFIAMAIGLFYLMEGFFSAELNEFAHFAVIIVFLISGVIAFFPKNIYMWIATVVLLILNALTYPSARKNNLQAHIEWAKSQNPYSSVESTKENIKNTTWQHTQVRLSTSKWYKLHFDNEVVEMHDAWPTDGKWTNKGTYTYVITEVRSPNDGHKCIEIRWGNQGIKYTFDMETSTLTEYLVGVGTQPPVYMQQEHQNPWRD